MAAHHLSSDTPHIVTVPGQFPPAKVWHAMSPEKWNSLKKSQHLRNTRIHSERSMILPLPPHWFLEKGYVTLQLKLRHLEAK